MKPTYTKKTRPVVVKPALDLCINFSNDLELDYILEAVIKRGKTSRNRFRLREIGSDFKKLKKVKFIDDRNAFYDFIRTHYLFKLLER